VDFSGMMMLGRKSLRAICPSFARFRLIDRIRLVESPREGAMLWYDPSRVD